MWTIPFSLEFISLASLSYINTHTLNGTTHINKVPQASRDCNPILVEQTQPLTLIASLTFLKKTLFPARMNPQSLWSFLSPLPSTIPVIFLVKDKVKLGSSKLPNFTFLCKNTSGHWAGQFGCLLELLGFAVLWLIDPLLGYPAHIESPCASASQQPLKVKILLTVIPQAMTVISKQ